MSHKIEIEIPSDGSCGNCPFHHFGKYSVHICTRFKMRIYDFEPVLGCENKGEGK